MSRFLLKKLKPGLKPSLNRKDLLACLLSGLILPLAYPPFEWSFLVWFALVPLLTRIRPETPVKNAWMGFFCGLVFYSIHLYWIYHVTVLGLVLLVLFLSMVFAALFAGIGYLQAKKGAVFTAALLWAGVEYLRSLGPFTFAWGYLGHALYAWVPLLQITPWVGVPGLSFLVFALNFSLARVYRDSAEKRESLATIWRRPSSLVLYGVIVLLAVVSIYGFVVMGKVPSRDENTVSYRIALIQAAIPHDEIPMADEKLWIHLQLSRKALESDPDLIVWPESTISVSLNYWPKLLEPIVSFADEHDVEILVGTFHDVRLGPGDYLSYNRAMHFEPGMEFDYLDEPIDFSQTEYYDKNQLVPFGEYVPFGDRWPLHYISPWIEQAIENAGVGLKDPGTALELIETQEGFTYGVAICFESTLAGQNARAVRMGADFLAVITYDSWFRRSAGLKQHFIQCAFRAAENRCYVVRSANTGITGVFDPTGRLVKTLAPHETGICVYDLPLSMPR